MKVKIFSNEGDAPKLETEINKWLLTNDNIEIFDIKQNYAYDNAQFFYALVSIWYKEKK
jgi:hypothetical protein